MNWLFKDEDGSVKLLMGNEAIARGAIEAGVQVAACYPGTPSSEIGEVLAEASKSLDLYYEWSTNETVAFEVAAGASLTGARAITAMKNAGFNLVMDACMTITYGGIKGGFVIVVADDPDAHYSSNEQDTRIQGLAAEIMVFEPQNQNQAKEMTKEAFNISEKLELPVLLRSVSRLSHASGNVILKDIRKNKNSIGFNKHWKLPYRWNVYGPPGPISKRKWLHSKMPLMKEYAEQSKYNELTINGSKIGVITSGIASCYALEALEELNYNDKVNLLNLGIINPLPEKKVSEILKNSSKIIVLEEGDPVLESSIRLMAKEIRPNIEIYGKMFDNSVLPNEGELNPDIAKEAIAKLININLEEDKARSKLKEEVKTIIPLRSTTLCPGCPHLGSYWALRKVIEKEKGNPIINGDIGCYEQGGYGVASKAIDVNDDSDRRYKISSPYEILDTIYVMGSGIGMAQGQYHAGHNGKIVAVSGDSTFYHTCMPSLVNSLYNNADITYLVLDNSWTCMTGHQPNPSTGVSSTGQVSKKFNIEEIVKAMGVEFVKTADPYNLKDSAEAIKTAIDYKGISVVVLRRECALQIVRKKETRNVEVYVNKDKCIGCKTCIQLGCPAITFKNKKAGIDKSLCMNCGICIQVCPVLAISERGGDHEI